MTVKAEEILKSSQLSITTGRTRILEYFINNHGALSHHDIEKKAGSNFDRVTIYRTLQTFLEKGIIHSIATNESGVSYALCGNHCSEGRHHDDHVHFVCV